MSDSALRPALPARILGHAGMLSLAALVLGPMLLMVGTSFKPASEVFSPVPWPAHPTLDNYREVFSAMPFAAYLWNSLATTVLRVAGELLIAIVAAYGFARWRFRGRGLLFLAVLGAMMVPQQLTMIPNYLLMAGLDWFDTWQALIVPHLAMPIGVFLLRQHFLAFPRELADAAEIDGAGSWSTLWRILVPNVRPAIAALAIVFFIDAWNEYFWPLLVTESDASMTVQIGIRKFLDQDRGSNYGALMAGVTLASLPALAVFFLFQRMVLNTFVSSGIKG
jgi:multiple sugar transport system permease protein/sn-glycerol 3-phosphate transport system permease protein